MKAKASWMMKEATDKAIDTDDLASQIKIKARSQVRIELWTIHSMSPVQALADALRRTEARETFWDQGDRKQERCIPQEDLSEEKKVAEKRQRDRWRDEGTKMKEKWKRRRKKNNRRRVRSCPRAAPVARERSGRGRTPCTPGFTMERNDSWLRLAVLRRRVRHTERSGTTGTCPRPMHPSSWSQRARTSATRTT